jgi:hypothetical protein
MTRFAERYLREVEALLNGPRGERRRLLDELRAHLVDAVAAGTPEAEAVEQLGSPGSVAAAWRSRCARESARVRRRVGVCVLGLTLASGLAVAGHAQGGGPKPAPAHGKPCVESTRGGGSPAAGRPGANNACG